MIRAKGAAYGGDGDGDRASLWDRDPGEPLVDPRAGPRDAHDGLAIRSGIPDLGARGDPCRRRDLERPLLRVGHRPRAVALPRRATVRNSGAVDLAQLLRRALVAEPAGR